MFVMTITKQLMYVWHVVILIPDLIFVIIGNRSQLNNIISVCGLVVYIMGVLNVLEKSKFEFECSLHLIMSLTLQTFSAPFFLLITSF